MRKSNFSLKCGAVASSIAHDSHNLIVAGDNDTDMMLAGNTVRKTKADLRLWQMDRSWQNLRFRWPD
ncbi:adenine deaminase C-terminal domain-containing protein [Faecalibacterium sp. CLA-AA-H281]|uniref:Adenine deaminase C-terminal domain-containing protein n=1 Tax=Faecalibacterium intestinale TaxID=3133155 RepID=A0ABV1C5X2_9FIRM